MNVLFTDTMTVYNYYRNPDTGEETWNRTVVKGIQWRHNKTTLSTSNQVQNEGKVESITIDFARDYGNKPYLPPNEYRKLKAEEIFDYWTLDVKTGQDMIVEGISDKEINGNYRLSALANDFQYIVVVKEVSDNRSRPMLKHIKVVGQ